MEADELNDLVAVLEPLLRSLEVLGLLSRHVKPYDIAGTVSAAGEPDAPLRAAQERIDAWRPELSELRDALALASDETLAAYDELRSAGGEEELMKLFGALRHIPRAQAALYPLAQAFPPVNRFFITPDQRGDADLQRRLMSVMPREDTGVMHVANEEGTRGGYSLYVPEDYTSDRDWPLVMALHGGSGHGRSFLWSWQRDARTHGAILVSPTATGRTWAISGPDADSPNLARILDQVRARWRVDPERLLLTGLSDGGTFSYVSGMETGSPFTHLAPVAAAFNPMLVPFADPARVRGLPIFIVHGLRDWMFPVEMAREAEMVLSASGAAVTYREIADLAHTYPREINPVILAWLDGRSPA